MAEHKKEIVKTEPKPAAQKTAAAKKAVTVKTAAVKKTAIAKTAANKPVSAKQAAAKPKTVPAPAARVEAAAVKPDASGRSVLYAASECNPFAGTGGLADVAASLPVALAQQGPDMRVVMPLYSEIPGALRETMTFAGSFYVVLAWRNQYCGVLTLKQNNVTYYFLDNEYYFKRFGLYGHYDDGERFAFFSKAVLEMCRFLNYYPDIVHCNDWQTSLIPVFLKTLYLGDEPYKKMRTVYTIHNIEYQGKYSEDIMENVLGIPRRFASILEYDGIINSVKGAIQCCDIISTVSLTYAQEILLPFYAHGLHYVLAENKAKLRGILNGIDTAVYDPATDKALFKNYDAASMPLKAENKTELQKLLHLPEGADIPMIAVISRMVQHKGMDLIRRKLDDMLKDKVQVVMLGKGDIHYENFFLDLQKSYSEKLRVIVAFNSDLARKIYAAADILLMPSKSEPCGLSQMIASRYGAVPVVRETGGLLDSIKDVGFEYVGNGFTFKNYDADDMLHRVRSALAMYKEKEKWEKLRYRVMTTDFSWGKSAKLYSVMYNSIL